MFATDSLFLKKRDTTIICIIFFKNQKNSFSKESSCIYGFHFYLFDRVGPFLAFFKPGFFLSLILGSLLSKPYGFNVSLRSASYRISALAMPSLIASDCPAMPHPVSVISASNCLILSIPSVERGANALSKRYRFPQKYSWSDLSLPLGVLTTKLPLPLAKSLTIAVVSFLLPIA